MSQKSPIKCKPIDSTYALCNINGEQIKCNNRPKERGLACHSPRDVDGNLICDPIDFICNLPKESVVSQTPSLLESFGLFGSFFVQKRSQTTKKPDMIEIVKINNVDCFYYFSYAEDHLYKLKQLYTKYYRKDLPLNIWNIMLTQTKAGSINNYTRNFFSYSNNVLNANDRVINTTIATLYPNKGKSTSGLIIPLPIEMLQILDQEKLSNYQRIIINPQIVIGPLEENKGDHIKCITYIGDVSISKGTLQPDILYLVEIATMLRDRRTFGLAQDLYTRKYTIDIRMNDAYAPTSCKYLRYHTDNTWTEEPCGFETS